MIELKDPSLFRTQCYANGEWQDGDEGSVILVDDPANGSIIGSVPKFGAEETRRTIDAASAAWGAWADMLPGERAGILLIKNIIYLISPITTSDPISSAISLVQGRL